uniref:Zinc finger, CCHC-type n=1 Tax=Tanacetum cinerariifolium TaxID=118510 RepID=A0A699I300_TANCI|nr:zinc finger, CCHC-type [Tanacetum cinerariifolium]
MAEEDAFLVDDVEGGLCVDYTDAEIVGRCYSGSFKYKGKWENDDYICKGHKLNGMSDSLFDVYQNVESAKKLWDSFKSKYMANDASRHVHYKRMLEMSKYDLIPAIDENLEKCTTSIHNLVIHQMDVKTVFFNGDLDEEVYMKQPEGFVMPGDEHTRFTCNLNGQHLKAITRVFKFLYGTMNYGLSYVGYPSMLEAFAASGNEAEWLRNLIHEIPIWLKTIAPISFHWDSAATFSKSYSQMYNGKSRHLGNEQSLEDLYAVTLRLGHVEIIKTLALANPETCLVRDRDGITPFHLAAIKGHSDVVKELMQALLGIFLSP